MKKPDAKFYFLLRSGSFFIAANVLAGVFHYLYQVFASKELSALEFSTLNGWFANLALFFLLGGILQYAANFFPLPTKQLRLAIIAINLLCITLVAAWFASPSGQTLIRAVLILVGASLFGWLMGQIQTRLMFSTMSVANLLIGATKLSLPFVTTMGTPLERYSFALFACYFPALWWVSISSWNCSSPNPSEKRAFSLHLWAAPILLATATAVIPQMDLVLVGKIQGAAVFAEFVRASLFYKGIYFLMFILAQWLLPQQIRGQARAAGRAWILAAAALICSAALTLVSPLVVQWILKWSEAPPMRLIFLSCLNMSLLTWLFLLIQEACARNLTRNAALALMGLGLEALLQLSLPPSMPIYFTAALVAQTILVTYLLNSMRKSRSA